RGPPRTGARRAPGPGAAPRARRGGVRRRPRVRSASRLHRGQRPPRRARRAMPDHLRPPGPPVLCAGDRRRRRRGAADAEGPGRARRVRGGRVSDRSLLDTIAAGELDDHLTALAQAVEARRALLYTVRSAGALAALCPGDLVRFTHAISPRYLAGRHATVVD